jgi:hypothetical protein
LADAANDWAFLEYVGQHLDSARALAFTMQWDEVGTATTPTLASGGSFCLTAFGGLSAFGSFVATGRELGLDVQAYVSRTLGSPAEVVLSLLTEATSAEQPVHLLGGGFVLAVYLSLSIAEFALRIILIGPLSLRQQSHRSLP